MHKKYFQMFESFIIEYANMKRAYDMPIQHYHNGYEFYLQLDGERYVFFNDECTNLEKGDLVIIKPFVLHYTESRDKNYYKRYVMNFSKEELGCILTDGEIDAVFSNITSGVIHLEKEAFRRVVFYFRQADAYTKMHSLFSKKLLYALLFEFVAYVDTLMPKLQEQDSQTVPEEISAAVGYVKEHYGDNISLDFMVEYVHMSKSHFCYRFKEVTGVSFMKYLQNYRMVKVHRLLLETNFSQREIAERTGFTSTAHMTRVFRQIHGCAPREFRKINKEDVKK